MHILNDSVKLKLKEYLDDILIEKTGQNIAVRSRNCLYLVNNKDRKKQFCDECSLLQASILKNAQDFSSPIVTVKDEVDTLLSISNVPTTIKEDFDDLEDDHFALDSDTDYFPDNVKEEEIELEPRESERIRTTRKSIRKRIRHSYNTEPKKTKLKKFTEKSCKICLAKFHRATNFSRHMNVHKRESSVNKH